MSCVVTRISVRKFAPLYFFCVCRFLFMKLLPIEQNIISITVCNMLIRVILVIFCGLVTLSQGFQLEYNHVRPSKAKEGGKSVIFTCKVDDWIQFCTFKHKNNKCVFGYAQNPDRFESVHCDAEFQGTVL